MTENAIPLWGVIGWTLGFGEVIRCAQIKISADIESGDKPTFLGRFIMLRWFVMYVLPTYLFLINMNLDTSIVVSFTLFPLSVFAAVESGHFLVWWRIWKDMYLCLIGKGDFSKDKTSYWK